MYLLADIPLNGSYQRSHDLHNCILQTRLQYAALMLSFVVEEGFYFRRYFVKPAPAGVSAYFSTNALPLSAAVEIRGSNGILPSSETPN